MTAVEFLRVWWEARGKFHSFTEEPGCIVAKIGPATVAFPIELLPRLRTHVGHEMAILRTDRDYRIRCLDEEAKNAT
jgi:hypothetical protein